MPQLLGQLAGGALSCAPINDPWVATSALQKAIRRGDHDVAFRATRLLIGIDPRRLWRRLVVIALEDVGVGDIDLAVEVLAVSGRSSWREANGGDLNVTLEYVRRLCSAPKSRDACDLLVIADLHPAYQRHRETFFDLFQTELAAIVVDQAKGIVERTIAAWYVGGTDRFPALKLMPRPGSMATLLPLFDRAGAEAVEASRLGATRTREGFSISLPIIGELTAGRQTVAVDENHSSLGLIGGWPSEAFDMHTRAGQRAMSAYVRRSRPMQDLLLEYLPPAKHAEFLGHLVFRLEGAVVDRRLQYDGQRTIEAAAKEAHLTYLGNSPEVIARAEALLHATWGELHEARLSILGALR
jgi:hypothetical protein